MNSQLLAVGILGTLAFTAAAHEVQADVKLHPIFTDNMVLQRDQILPVWGTADPGEKVSVVSARSTSLKESSRPLSAVADANGNWRVNLKPLEVGDPVVLTVSGKNSISLKNIAVGDVYICSGQSNMEWPVSAVNNAALEVATARFPNIRLLTVPKKIAGKPQTGFAAPTSWLPCTPETVPGFSAVGYFFGRELYQKTGIPIGLINASWGGTVAEAWISRNTLLARPDMHDPTLQTEAKFAAGTEATPLPADLLNNPNQPSVLYNGMIAPLVPFSVRGAVWYQGESNADRATQYQTLFPGLIRDWRTQWNAKQDGSAFGFYFVQLANFMERVNQPVQSGWAELREAQTMALNVPRTGMATILDIGDAGDIHPRNKQDVGKRLAQAALVKEYGQKIEYSGPTFSKMEVIRNTNSVRISFTHAKGLKASGSYPASSNQNEYPDVPPDHWAYAAIEKLIQAGVMQDDHPGQYNGGGAMTRYEFAVAIARLLENLHPTGPGPSGVIGPQPAVKAKEIKLTPDLKVILSSLEYEFSSELQALGMYDLKPHTTTPAIKGFAVKGEDGVWYWAHARLQGDTVVVWSSEVTKPVAVRYAWMNNPNVNLLNGDGLPAVSFRTDAK